MAWPIPDIPEKESLPTPKYWFWIIVLILMLVAGSLSSLWVWNMTTYAEVFFTELCQDCLFGYVSSE